jgi:hypothetical protein
LSPEEVAVLWKDWDDTFISPFLFPNPSESRLLQTSKVNMHALKLTLLFIGLAMATPIDNPLLVSRTSLSTQSIPRENMNTRSIITRINH